MGFREQFLRFPTFCFHSNFEHAFYFPAMTRRFPYLLLPILAVLLLLAGCIYDYAPSGPVRDIDTWLLGKWATQDKAGHQFNAVVTRDSVDHYRVEFQQQGGETLVFNGWISRVDDFSILVLRSMNEGPTFGKFALYHYELLSKGPPANPGDIGANRIRLSELQLDESTRTLESYKLRAAIRKSLKDGSLLVPHNVVADLKTQKVEIPGSIVWSKTGGVTFNGETF